MIILILSSPVYEINLKSHGSLPPLLALGGKKKKVECERSKGSGRNGVRSWIKIDTDGWSEGSDDS